MGPLHTNIAVRSGRMRMSIPVIMLALLALAVFVPVADADSTSLYGYGSADGIEAYYVSGEDCIMTVCLGEKPSAYQTVSVLALDSSGEEWIVENIEQDQIFSVFLPPLHPASYEVIVTLTETGTLLGECTMTVGEGCVMTYSAGQGSGFMPFTVADSDGKVRLPECTLTPPEGRSFVQWSINGENHGVGETITITGNTTAKAVWEAGMFTVSYDPGEGSGAMPSAVKYAGEKLTLPQCGFTAPEGKGFSSWRIDGLDYHPGDVITVTQDTKVLAVWIADQPSGGDDSTMLYVGIAAAVVIIVAVAGFLILRRRA